jgi:cell wall assembly regulator SMI1
MKIKIQKNKNISQEQISQCEQEIGIKFPKDYYEFLLDYNGAEPSPNIFDLKGGDSAGVNQFIPISEIARSREKTEGFPKNMLPIAWASCGNYVYLNPLSGGIYFWDHEIQDADYKVADNFSEFLAILKPFDLNQIELKPGQVKAVWGNPDFKPTFK